MTCTYSVLNLPERIASKIQINESGCWCWTAGKNRKGYGIVGRDGSTLLAHRLVYELLAGKIQKGLELDHICRRRNCTNPAHLEQVTHRENVLRGVGPIARNAAKTHCKHGHELSVDNLVPKDWLNRGHRRCLACTKAWEQARYARHVAKKQAEIEANGPKPSKPRRIKTHCIHGHALTPDNLVPSLRNRRACLTCARDRARVYQARKRALAGGAQ